jgi:hypothetical protein
MDNETINKVIYFLFDQAKPLPASLLNSLYTQKHEKIGSFSIILNELERIGIIKTTGGPAIPSYSLNISARRQIEILPTEFKGKPYEYFLFEEGKKKQNEEDEKWYNMENARLQYEDYPTTRWQSKAAFYISAALLILEVIKLITHKN